MVAMAEAKTVSKSEDLLRLTKEVDMEAQEVTTTLDESKESAKTPVEKTEAKVLETMIEAMHLAATTATLVLSVETVEMLAVVWSADMELAAKIVATVTEVRTATMVLVNKTVAMALAVSTQAKL